MEIIDVDNDYLTPWNPIFSNGKTAVHSAKHRITGEEHIIKTVQITNLEDIDEYYTEVLVHPSP